MALNFSIKLLYCFSLSIILGSLALADGYFSSVNKNVISDAKIELTTKLLVIGFDDPDYQTEGNSRLFKSLKFYRDSKLREQCPSNPADNYPCGLMPIWKAHYYSNGDKAAYVVKNVNNELVEIEVYPKSKTTNVVWFKMEKRDKILTIEQWLKSEPIIRPTNDASFDLRKSSTDSSKVGSCASSPDETGGAVNTKETKGPWLKIICVDEKCKTADGIENPFISDIDGEPPGYKALPLCKTGWVKWLDNGKITFWPAISAASD